jgi:hypothetical protein
MSNDGEDTSDPSSMTWEVRRTDRQVSPRVARRRRSLGMMRPWKVRAAHILDASLAQMVVRFHPVSRAVSDVMGPRLHVFQTKIDVIPRGRDPARLGSWSERRREAARASVGADQNTMVLLALARQVHEGARRLDCGTADDLRAIPQYDVATCSGEGTPQRACAPSLIGSRLTNTCVDSERGMTLRNSSAPATSWCSITSRRLHRCTLRSHGLGYPAVATTLPPFGKSWALR